MLIPAKAAINNAYNVITGIQTAQDLRSNKLTLSDYHAAMDIFNEVNKPGAAANTFIKAVADFYKSCGYSVKQDAAGVNYIIYTEA